MIECLIILGLGVLVIAGYVYYKLEMEDIKKIDSNYLEGL